MKIRKTSWHYRLVKAVTPTEKLVKNNGELPTMNLCTYFWTVVGIFTIAPIVGPIMLFFFTLIFLCERLEILLPSKKAKEELVPPKEPKTLFGKWLKAKKDKVCPFLEWTE